MAKVQFLIILIKFKCQFCDPKKISNLSTLATAHRIFKLIELLSRPPYYTVQQLSHMLDVSKQAVYRYIGLLENLGFLIDANIQHRYFIALPLHKNEHDWTHEELEYIYQCLTPFKGINPVAEFITGKIKQKLKVLPSPSQFRQLQRGKIIQQIQSAIQKNNKIRLVDYFSLSRNQAITTILEPIQMSPDYKYLVAWDTQEEKEKQYKITRMETIEILPEEISVLRTGHSIDIFGMMGTSWIPVRLVLSYRAWKLLLEEHPRASEYIYKENGKIYFNGQVRDLPGIGRFIMGLPGEVEIIDPPELVRYLQKKVEEFTFR